MKLTGSFLFIQGQNTAACISDMQRTVESALFYKVVTLNDKPALMFEGGKVTVAELKFLLNKARNHSCRLYAFINGKLMNVNTGDNQYPCWLHLTEIGTVVPSNKINIPQLHLFVDGKMYEIVGG